MRTIMLAFLLFLIPPDANADTCSFAWECDGTVDGYRLYLKSGDQYQWLWTGVYKTATVEIPHGTKGDVVVRAFIGTREGNDSVPWPIKLVGKPKR